MSDSPPPDRPAIKLPRRIAWSCYLSAFFCDSYTELFQIIVPLWAIYLGMSPLEIGILVSARAFLPFILAIHGGVLIDRFGTRRMMIIVSAACLALPLLFPLAPWLPAMLLLQTVGGLVSTWAWVGCQTQAMHISHANTDFVSRFAFFARAGAMSGPVAIGIAWDVLGPWPSFVIAAVWGGVFLATSLLIPDTVPDDESGQPGRKTQDGPPRPFSLMDLMPRLSDYISAIALTAIPAVAFVVAGSFVRSGAANMQNSFYVVYLQELDFPGTLIGLLIGLTQGAAGFGSLAGGLMERIFRPQRAFLITVFMSVVFIAITPLLGGIFALLATAVVLRGFFQGVSQPIMFTYLSRAVGVNEQATSIGLRTTANRMSVLVLPVLMGAVAEIIGVGPSFLVMGGFLLVLLAAIVLFFRQRRPAPGASAA